MSFNMPNFSRAGFAALIVLIAGLGFAGAPVFGQTASLEQGRDASRLLGSTR
jgi:hypothetical protein